MTYSGHVRDPGSDHACANMYYLVDPPIGTYSVHLGSQHQAKMMAAVLTLYGVDQTDPLVDDGEAWSYNGSSVASLILDSQPGDLADLPPKNRFSL